MSLSDSDSGYEKMTFFSSPMRAAEPLTPRLFLRNEMGMVFGVATMGIFQLFGTAWVANLSNKVKAVALFAWLFVAIFWLAFGVVRHADCLAVLLGEPYGTLILTVSVIGIEAAMMAALMLQGEDNPTLARDTMFSVIMIVLTGIVGVTAPSRSASTRRRSPSLCRA